MAGRKDKNVVDYFPHQCEHGKTMFILEEKYPFKGYCVWFKTLEILGKSENHFIDCRSPKDWLYLSAMLRIEKEELEGIYNTLAETGAIHEELWRQKIIWSGNFIKNMEYVYKRRNDHPMYFNFLIQFLKISVQQKYDRYGNLCTPDVDENGNDDNIKAINVCGNTINDNGNEQSKVKESKVKKKRVLSEEEKIYEEDKIRTDRELSEFNKQLAAGYFE